MSALRWYQLPLREPTQAPSRGFGTSTLGRGPTVPERPPAPAQRLGTMHDRRWAHPETVGRTALLVSSNTERVRGIVVSGSHCDPNVVRAGGRHCYRKRDITVGIPRSEHAACTVFDGDGSKLVFRKGNLILLAVIRVAHSKASDPGWDVS